MNNRCFNCQVKDKIVRSLSASGRISALLASAVIEQNGIVYGAAYSNDFRRVDIDWVDNMHDYYARISKSKYVYSFMPKFDEIRQKVENGRKVLIGALPCQIVALAKFLGKKYPNLYMAALKCHGSTNPKIYSCFIDRIEEENKSKLISFDFRKNHKFEVVARFANGKTIVYCIDLFMNNNCEHCQSCKVKWDNEYADFIIGDYWEYQKNRETLFDQSLTVKDGISFLKVKTEKGMKLFEQVKEQLNYKEFDNSKIKY